MSTELSAHVAGLADAGFPGRVLDALDGLWASAPTVAAEDRELFALAVSEIATNVVTHARAREPIHIEVTLRVGEDVVEAVFADDGDPALIDLSKVDMPSWDAESGRGLALALAALDELTHETADGNTWRLRRWRRPPSA